MAHMRPTTQRALRDTQCSCMHCIMCSSMCIQEDITHQQRAPGSPPLSLAVLSIGLCILEAKRREYLASGPAARARRMHARTAPSHPPATPRYATLRHGPPARHRHATHAEPYTVGCSRHASTRYATPYLYDKSTSHASAQCSRGPTPQGHCTAPREPENTGARAHANAQGAL